eukprot:COSAG01_NODE_36_length_34092_cov_26.350032_23_plen_144_part_00
MAYPDSRATADETAVHWFVLLRLFPYAVCGPTRKAHNGGRQMQQRLEKWRNYEWQELCTKAAELEESERARRAQRAPRVAISSVSDQPDDDEACEHLLARAARLAREGYYSRAAKALAGQPLAPSDEATWRGLQSRHPRAPVL